MRKFLTGLCLLMPLSCLSAQAAPKPVHQLQPRQIRLLKALQAPIAVPGYLPAGCELNRVSVSDRGIPPLGPGEGPAYEIVYFCADSVNFTIRGESSGFGGPDGDKREMVWNPVYGQIPILIFLPGGHTDTPTPFYYSDWIGKGPIYFSLISGENKDPQLPLPEARKVLQGLTLLK